MCFVQRKFTCAPQAILDKEGSLVEVWDSWGYNLANIALLQRVRDFLANNSLFWTGEWSFHTPPIQSDGRPLAQSYLPDLSNQQGLLALAPQAFWPS